MQDSRKNALEPGRGGGPPGLKEERLLNACGEAMAARLGSALAATLEFASGELLELTDRVLGLEMRRLYDEAREFAKGHQAPVETSCRHLFLKRFKDACRRGARPSISGFDPGQLSLQEPDDLEEDLAASNIANAINNLCGEELFGLTRRMGVLLDDPELRSADNPIGPEVIGAAIMESLKAQGARIKIQLILVPLINRQLPKQIREIYQELNGRLVEAGVLPTIRVGGGVSSRTAPGAARDAGRAAGMAGPPPQPAPGPALDPAPGPAPGTPAQAAQAAGQDLFAVIQRLLDAGAAPAAAGEAPTTSAPALMQTLTRLQRGQLQGVPASLEAPRGGSGELNVLRGIKDSPLAAGMGQVDAMTLDIVAMMFDYILDDRRVPDPMKTLIGRLQIPVLKVAMLDRGFFSHKTHPARRLLDALAEAAMGWHAEEGQAGGLYKKVKDLIQHVINHFDQDLEVFTRVLAELERYLKAEKQQIDLSASKSAQIIHEQERREIARVVAAGTVQGHLAERPTPELIRLFLSEHWTRLLTDVHARAGEGSPAWQQAVATMDDLIWSATPKTVPAERKKLITLLPKLLKRLDEGMRNVGLADAARDQFFTGLVKCHAVAVKAAMQGGLDATDHAALGMDTVRPAAAPPEPDGPAALEFTEMPPPDDSVRPDPALLREIASDPAEVEEITIGDVSWLAGGEWHRKDEFDELVMSLKRGTWIELTQEDGGATRMKLAWTSPLKGIYLFTNRLGQRAMSIKADGLTAQFRDGRVRILENVPLVERAVNSLLEKLRQSAREP